MKSLAVLLVLVSVSISLGVQAQETGIPWTSLEEANFEVASPGDAGEETVAQPERIWLERTGEYRRCLATADIQITQIPDSRTIVFRLYGGEYFVSRLARPCPALSKKRNMGYAKRHFREICADDMVTVFGPRELGPSCRLYQFEKVAETEPSE